MFYDLFLLMTKGEKIICMYYYAKKLCLQAFMQGAILTKKNYILFYFFNTIFVCHHQKKGRMLNQDEQSCITLCFDDNNIVYKATQ